MEAFFFLYQGCCDVLQVDPITSIREFNGQRKEKKSIVRLCEWMNMLHVQTYSHLVLCKKTNEYHCADIESLYRVASVVHNSSVVIASDLLIINVFGNISFVSLMGFIVTVMRSAACCNIHSLSSYTSCGETTSVILHLLWGIYWLDPSEIKFVTLCNVEEKELE